MKNSIIIFLSLIVTSVNSVSAENDVIEGDAVVVFTTTGDFVIQTLTEASGFGYYVMSFDSKNAPRSITTTATDANGEQRVCKFVEKTLTRSSKTHFDSLIPEFKTFTPNSSKTAAFTITNGQCYSMTARVW